MTSPAFRDWIDRAKAVRIAEVLDRRSITLTGRGKNRMGPCPHCGGEDRFGVDVSRDLFNCRGCGAKGQGAISFVRWLDGLDFLQACEAITGQPPPHDEKKPSGKQRERKPRGHFVCTYSYLDELDTEQYQVVRYAEPKSFSQRRPDALHEGEWIENLTGCRLVPYKLPDVIEGLANEHTIYWFEGEKDVDTAVSLGLIATTTAMGTAGKAHWERGAYDEFFRDADVVLVPDQDPEDHKGRALARVIGARLKNVARSVKLLVLPAKDLTAWVEQGATREDFDALPVSDFIVEVNGNGNGHNPDGMAGFEEARIPPPEIVIPPPIEPTAYVLPDPATIPRRGWLYGMHYIRKAVTATVAPGGFGKTTLALFEAMLMVQFGYRVWYISGEDDKDELDRRIAAHCAIHQPGSLGGRLFVDDKMTFPFKIAQSGRNGPEFDNIRLVAFEAAILKQHIDVVILDPFVSFHFLPENDTASMDALIKRLGDICVRCDCCIELSHHVRKPGMGQVEITVYDARGAGAIINATRSCRVLNQMTETEAQQVKALDKPSSYIRIDSGKRNMAPPDKARWRHLISVEIANGDHVQALEDFEFKVAAPTVADDEWLKRTMASGTQYRADTRSPDWLGHEVARHFERNSDSKGDIQWINSQIKTWMTSTPYRPALLRKVERPDKNRKFRSFFELIETPTATDRMTEPETETAQIIKFPTEADDE